MNNKIEQLQQIIDEGKRIVFFTGAGVSTDSGIPDFRSQDGLYNQKYKYPPEGMDDAVKTVMSQCEMWVDNMDNVDLNDKNSISIYEMKPETTLSMVAEETAPYGVVEKRK